MHGSKGMNKKTSNKENSRDIKYLLKRGKIANFFLSHFYSLRNPQNRNLCGQIFWRGCENFKYFYRWSAAAAAVTGQGDFPILVLHV